MKQKLALLVLLLVTAVSFTGCGSSKESVPEKTAVSEDTLSDAAPADASRAAVQSGSEENAEGTEESFEYAESLESAAMLRATSMDLVNDMAPAIDALIRCCWENGYSYSDDPWFFWTAMSYHLGANYGLRSNQVTVMKDYVRIPQDIVREYAASLFADCSDLPEIPEELTKQISYDSSSGMYHVALGDIGHTQLLLVNPQIQEDDSVIVTANLADSTETSKLIGSWDVHLVRNQHLDGVKDPIFYYSVESMELLTEGDIVSNSMTLTFVGLEDNHTAVFAEKGGEELVFQFNNEEVRQVLQGAVIGSRYALIYTTDQQNGTWTIRQLTEQ
ncbi:MAG: hypothetical protein ACI4DV_06160 [Lachnospiraceae bacterium]